METANPTPKTNLTKSKTADFAVIDFQNQQFLVNVGIKITVPLQKTVTAEQKIIFDQVLLTHNQVGTPYVANFAVEGKVITPLKKEKKITVFKYKSKKNYRVKTGHRQKTTIVEITKLLPNFSPKKSDAQTTNK